MTFVDILTNFTGMQLRRNRWNKECCRDSVIGEEAQYSRYSYSCAEFPLRKSSG